MDGQSARSLGSQVVGLGRMWSVSRLFWEVSMCGLGGGGQSSFLSFAESGWRGYGQSARCFGRSACGAVVSHRVVLGSKVGEDSIQFKKL